MLALTDDRPRIAEAALAAAQRGNFVDAAAGYEHAAPAHFAVRDPGAVF